MDNSEEISQRIKRLREALGISQRAFSRLLSLSAGYISGVEINSRPVNDRLVKQIVSEFGVDKDWLLTGKGQMFVQKDTDERSARLMVLFNGLSRKYQDVVFGVIDLLRNAKNE
jgi:transcriptional regulator with XRE-family HTH domain